MRFLEKRKKKIQVNLIDARSGSEETRDIVVDDKEGKFAFSKKLCLLAQLLISYLMTLITS